MLKMSKSCLFFFSATVKNKCNISMDEKGQWQCKINLLTLECTTTRRERRTDKGDLIDNN